MSGLVAPAGGKPPNIQIFLVSGTYTPTDGAKSALVSVTGAGGGGGSSANNAYGAGAGSTSIKNIDLEGIASAAVVIGAGGVGGLYSTNGSASSFDDGTNILTANGGLSSGRGGDATGGDINIKGGAGSRSNSGFPTGQTGGGGIYGTGGGQGTTDIGAYGGGGAVGRATSGGAGGDGIVKITEFF